MPPSSKLLHRCAVRSWMSAAAAISVAFSFNCHKPITNNQSRGHNLLSSKIDLVQSVNMANCWPKHSAVLTVEALQTVGAPFARLDRIASTAWTLDAVGPAQLSQVISGFLVIYQVWYQVFHGVAPMELKQPHYTDTAWLKLL